MSDGSRKKSGSTSFKPIKQVGVAVSIGFPLMVIGALTLVVFLVTWVGTATALWILAGLVLAVGILAAMSNRVI
jgi:Flp pilus assembly protein TadB